VVIDALRCAKLAKNNGIAGELLGPSAYFMKSPAIQYTDEQARLMVEEFIRENALDARPAQPKAPAHANGHSLAEASAVRDLPSVD
jgi:myo-inositol-1-phosphate synthase